MLRVRRGEGCLVIYGLVVSFKAEKKKVNVGDVCFWVSSNSLFLGAGVLVSCLLYRFSLLIGSNWVFFVFNREDHGLAEKLLLIIIIFLFFLFYFFDKFHWHFAMRWSSFFHFEECLSIHNIRWMLSRGR